MFYVCALCTSFVSLILYCEFLCSVWLISLVSIYWILFTWLECDLLLILLSSGFCFQAGVYLVDFTDLVRMTFVVDLIEILQFYSHFGQTYTHSQIYRLLIRVVSLFFAILYFFFHFTTLASFLASWLSSFHTFHIEISGINVCLISMNIIANQYN